MNLLPWGLGTSVILVPSFPGTLGSPHHLLLINNSQLLDYTAHHLLSHIPKQLKGARWLVSPALTMPKWQLPPPSPRSRLSPDREGQVMHRC